MSAIPGRTSKIKRYYWREIAFRQMRLYSEWRSRHPKDEGGADGWVTRADLAEKALDEIKHLHAINPKYRFEEPSQQEVIEQFSVQVIDLRATYGPVIDDKAQIVESAGSFSVEEYVCRHFRNLGFEAIFSESSPFHVLFGVFLWLLVQEQSDLRVRVVGIADRKSPPGEKTRPSWFLLPDDFGTPGYGIRRKAAIDEYFLNILPDNSEELLWAFDYWLEPSQTLRQYLWAEEQEAIRTARRMVEILPPQVVRSTLRYLADSYWENYCGWPDLLIFRGSDFFFAEVKSSHDKLSPDQKHWIAENHARLKLPFKIVKVHRASRTS